MTSVGIDMNILIFSYIGAVNIKKDRTFGKQFVEIILNYDWLSNCTPMCILKRMKKTFLPKTCTWMSKSPLFLRMEVETSQISLTDEWL